jgi:tellurite resistance protein
MVKIKLVFLSSQQSRIIIHTNTHTQKKKKFMSTEQQSNNNSSHELSVIDFVIIGIYLIVIVIVGLLASVLQKWLERRERGGQEHQQRLEEGLSTQEQDDITQNALQMERKQKFDEFFLGGRSIPWWVCCFSLSLSLANYPSIHLHIYIYIWKLLSHVDKYD